MNLVNNPGLWQHFVNRYDNVGRPIMEVKQKYLTEINAYESTLAQGNFGVGGGTAPIVSTIPSITVTPSVTPTISVTPSVTPTISITPTRTPTPTPSASPPTVYSFSFTSCCAGVVPTLYSSSPSIQVGVYLYTNIGLTNPFYQTDHYLVEGSFDCNQQTYSGIFTNPTGLVTSTTHNNYCGD